ncbi:MAG: prolipoprotein diacylglyceryl transferase [Pseudobdellovibrionaceae bacterium]
MAITFPKINPIALDLGFVQIHWYALAYVVGFLLAWRGAVYLSRLHDVNKRPTAEDIDDFISWAILGVLLGGRVGYVLFYNLPVYLEHPENIIKVWQGGMAFHGGVLGVMLALFLFSHFKKVPLLRLADISTAVIPIGLFLGRIANFVNGELYGRITDEPWGIVFPRGGPEPRHPSQLYEAWLEGAVLLAITLGLSHIKGVRDRPGIVSGAFLFFYGLFRIIAECFREPDVQLGFLFEAVTMGQILSVPMMMVGAGLMGYAVWRKRRVL